MKSNKSVFLENNKDILARIEMQEQIITNFEKEIYGNINQVLCLVRIKLFNLDLADKRMAGESLAESSNLIAKAISDLRNLAKQVNSL